MQTIDYIPEVLKDIKEFKVITSCYDKENYEISTAVENLYKDQFIATTEKALERYEKMLKIEPKKTETLEERRFKILAIYNKQLPYTKVALEKNLLTFCGRDGYSIYIDYNNKILIVKISLAAKSMFDTVNSYLESVVPVNLIIDLALLYNTYEVLAAYTHEQLAKYTYYELREEVIANGN